MSTKLTHRFELRLTEVQRKALADLGGNQWIRDRIDAATLRSDRIARPLGVVLHCPMCGVLTEARIYGKEDPLA